MKTIAIAALILIGCGSQGDRDMRGQNQHGDRWERLSHGQPLGKSIIIAVPSTGFGEPRPGVVDLLQLSNANDELACQIAITLLPPQYRSQSEFPGAVFPVDLQNASGFRYNDSMYASPPPVPVTGQFDVPPAVAVIRWGVGGQQAIAEVDFSNGAVVNLTASFVRVSAFVDLLSESFPEGTAVQLSAFVGPGWPKPNNAQRTYSVQPILPGGFNQFGYTSERGYFAPPPPPGGLVNLYPVPFFGKQATVIGIDPNVAAPGTLNTLDVDLIFYASNLGNIRVGSFHITNDNPGPVIVPNGAMYWAIQNNVAISQTLSVVFDLNI